MRIGWTIAVFGLLTVLLASACGNDVSPSSAGVGATASTDVGEYATVEPEPEPETMSIRFTQPVSSPKGYTGELDFEIALPSLRLGDPGMVVVAAPGGTAQFNNTTPGGREVMFYAASYLGSVNMYWKIPRGLVASIPGLDTTRCNGWTERSKKKPYLVTKFAFAPDDPDRNLPAGVTPLVSMGENILNASQIADSNGVLCMNAPIAAFPESFQPEVDALLRTMPSYVQVSQGGLRFADGMFGICTTPGGFASSGELIVNTFDPSSGPESSTRDFGDCTLAER